MFGVAVKVLRFGTWLGIAACPVLGREFRDDELGILLWSTTRKLAGPVVCSSASCWNETP